MGHPNKTFLNKDLEICGEDSARYLSKDWEEGGNERAREIQELEPYTSALTDAAEKISQERTPEPVGSEGKEGEQRRIAGMLFVWEETHWAYDWLNYSIEINPAADRKDAEACLEVLKTIKEGVLTRGRASIEHTAFRIGSTQKEEKGCVASAEKKRCRNRWENIIRFPFCTDKCRLLAACLDEAFNRDGSPAHLLKIVLHEIGHTLKLDFYQERENLLGISDLDFSAIRPALKLISPHYLNKQATQIELQLVAEQAEAYTETDVEKRRAALKRLKAFTTKIGRKIFAEMVRFYYLQPSVDKKWPNPPNTGFESFDMFATKLIGEAQLNREKDAPVFPLGNSPNKESGLEMP